MIAGRPLVESQEAIAEALVFLRAARDRLKVVKAKGATAKVRAAITSTQNELRDRHEVT